jgi:cytochrome c
MDQQGNYVRMERFMENTVFNKPVHMQFGKDGALYVLEYGTFWNAQNDDARLSRLEFSEGNRKPLVKASLNKSAAAAPATIAFSSQGSFDYDPNDQLSYEWTFDTPGVVQSREANPTFTFTRPGVYKPVLKVKDAAGKEATTQLEVQIGNEPPQVTIEVLGNRSFYWDQTPLNYRVKVTDKEDGNLEKGTIPAKQVRATFSYLPEGQDIIQATQGHQLPPASNELKGKVLMDGSDCKACHALDRVSVGPSFMQVAQRYKADVGAVNKLALKIINGGGGSWGDREMAAHPQISKPNAAEMVRYILSLAEPKKASPVATVPLKGKLSLNQHLDQGGEGTYLLAVSYQDQGALNMSPLTGRDQVMLRHPKVLAADGDEFKGAAKANNGNSRLIKFTEDNAYLSFKNIDLTNIKAVVCTIDPNNTSGKIELRLGSPTGKLLGSTATLSKSDRPANAKPGRWFDGKINLEPTTGMQDVYVVFRSPANVSIWNAFLLNTLYFQL